MKSKAIYFLNQDLGIKYTGIENAALLRSRLFLNHLGVIPSFITYKYRSQLATEVQELKDKRKLPLEVEVINIYDFFQELGTSAQKNFYLYEGEFEVSLTGIGYKKYVNSQGVFKASAIYNQYNQRLHYIVHFDQGKRWRRDYYHESGSLSCTHLLDDEGQKVLQEIFYRADRSICLIKQYRYQEAVAPSVTIQVLDQQGNVILKADRDEVFITYFLKRFLAEKEGLSVLLIDKNRDFYLPAMAARSYYGRDRIQIIVAIHNLHAVNYHKKETSRINVNYVEIFEDLSQPDAVIVQTNIQKNDIIERFGETYNIYAIPHTYESSLKHVNLINRNTVKAVYFARYNHDKKHELAIEAFAKVVKVLPKAEFHCYGAGSRLVELQKLVQQLEMTQNIFLHGWCENVAEQYESAAVSVISSPSESFSLTIAESLAHGCPVVGFDVPYGPKELIQSGENGYLVPYSDTDMMADKIIQIMTDLQLQRRLSDNARESSQRYSEVVVRDQWLNLFQNIGLKQS